MAKAKSRFPSKKEVMNLILEENPSVKGFNKFVLILEYKKINSNLAVTKGELSQNKKILLKGSITCIPDKNEDSFNWGILKNGESYFSGFSLDHKGESIASLIMQGVKKSIKEGKFPFK